MEKIKKMFRTLRRNYRKRRLYKLAELDASVMCGSMMHILPAEVYVGGDREIMLRETRRILHEYKQLNQNGWPSCDEDEDEQI